MQYFQLSFQEVHWFMRYLTDGKVYESFTLMQESGLHFVPRHLNASDLANHVAFILFLSLLLENHFLLLGLVVCFHDLFCGLSDPVLHPPWQLLLFLLFKLKVPLCLFMHGSEGFYLRYNGVECRYNGREMIDISDSKQRLGVWRIKEAYDE